MNLRTPCGHPLADDIISTFEEIAMTPHRITRLSLAAVLVAWSATRTVEPSTAAVMVVSR